MYQKNYINKVLLVSNTAWSIYNYRISLIKALKKRNIKVAFASPEDYTVAYVKALGIKYHPIRLNRKGTNPLEDLSLIIQLKKIYKQENPDYIIHFTIKPVIYGTFAEMILNRHNIINMIPGLGYVFGGNTIKHKAIKYPVKVLYRIAFNYSYRDFFQNPDDRDYFVHKNIINEGKTVVTYGSGVDLDHFTASQVSNRKHCNILMMGRMLKEKGVLEYIAAARILKRKYKDVNFNLLGIFDNDNPSKVDKTIVLKAHKAGIINLLNQRDDVRPVLENNDIIVLPSYYQEGIPRSLLEGMAMGMPVITTEWTGCKETVAEGVNGLLVPPKNVEKLVRAMECLIGSKTERNRMGKESRKRVEKKFDVRRVNQLFLAAMGID